MTSLEKSIPIAANDFKDTQDRIDAFFSDELNTEEFLNGTCKSGRLAIDGRKQAAPLALSPLRHCGGDLRLQEERVEIAPHLPAVRSEDNVYHKRMTGGLPLID